MSEIRYTFQNYRAFAQEAPLTIPVVDGITFILGPNNVGKSSLIRGFVELPKLLFGDNGQVSSNHQLKSGFATYVNRKKIGGPIVVGCEYGSSKWTATIKSRSGNEHANDVDVVVDCLSGGMDPEGARKVRSLFVNVMYVPSFRSPTVNAQDSIFGMSIGRTFVSLWDEWANGRRIDHSESISLLVEELKSLFQFNRFEVAVAKSNEHLLITTDEGRFQLDELGDGLSHFIVVLGNAMIKQPDWILIDEPEIGLHPKMQELFVRVLASKAKYGLIATSHSVGLARSVADQVLMMTKEPTGKRRLEPFGQHFKTTIAQSISEMGYSQFAELGAEHLLLVEGRTDIKAFREILRKFDLDQHFLIWSLNGSDWLKSPPESIEDELNELKRLEAKSISVIFDSEKGSSVVDMAEVFRPFYELCLRLGFNAFPTDRHSTENYVTQSALDKVCPGMKAIAPFEDFRSANPKWSKSKNWLLFREMTASDFDGTKLGEFVSKTLGGLVKVK